MTTKVFVGNLAFQTTDQALAEAFQDCGKVKSGVVITRGRRSLGYGFVEFEAPESALDAVKSKNNTLLKGRTLKVELASDNPVRSADRLVGGGSSSNNPQGGQTPSQNNNNNDPNAPNGPSGSNQNRGGNQGGDRGRRKRNNRRRRIGGGSDKGGRDNNEGGGQQQGQGQGQNKNPAGGAPRNKREGGQGPRGGQREQGQGQQGGQGRRRNNNNNNNGPQNNEDRVLSRTAVFVANLPFPVKDEDLLNFFKDSNPKSAHVVVTRNGRSRGYGFVDFDNEKDQALAIQSKNNAKFLIGESERVITVTPSYKTQEVTPENN